MGRRAATRGRRGRASGTPVRAEHSKEGAAGNFFVRPPTRHAPYRIPALRGGSSPWVPWASAVMSLPCPWVLGSLGPGALGSAFKKKASRPARGPPMAAKSALACLLTKAKPWRHLLGPGDRKQPHHSAITAPKCPRDLKFFSPSANFSCGACLRRPCGAAKQALRSQPPALSRGP